MADNEQSEVERDELVEFLEHFHFIYPNLNDTFHYATADSERIALDGASDEEGWVSDQDVLVDVWRRFGGAGIIAYVARIRGTEPIEPVRTQAYLDAVEYLGDWQYEGD